MLKKYDLTFKRDNIEAFHEYVSDEYHANSLFYYLLTKTRV